MSIEAHEICGLRPDEGAEGSRIVASAELLDLDDARTKVGKDHRAIRPSQNAGKVEHRDARQGTLSCTGYVLASHGCPPVCGAHGSWPALTGSQGSPLPQPGRQNDICQTYI
jgi:hypothetical protein